MQISKKPYTSNHSKKIGFGFKILPAIPGIAPECHLQIQRSKISREICGLSYKELFNSFVKEIDIKLPDWLLKILNSIIKPPKREINREYYLKRMK